MSDIKQQLKDSLHTDLVERLRSDKAMVEGDVPGIYEWRVRPLSREAANTIEALRLALREALDDRAK